MNGEHKYALRHGRTPAKGNRPCQIRGCGHQAARLVEGVALCNRDAARVEDAAGDLLAEGKHIGRVTVLALAREFGPDWVKEEA